MIVQNKMNLWTDNDKYFLNVLRFTESYDWAFSPEMEAMRSSETLVTIYKTARPHKLEDHNRYLHRLKNLQS
jgi:hypothetical protein